MFMRDGIYEFEDGNTFNVAEMQDMLQAQQQQAAQEAAAARPPVDPYAPIRSLQFYRPQVTQRFIPGHGGEGDYWEQLETPELGDWTPDFNALKPHGFQSKYSGWTDYTADYNQFAEQLGGRRVVGLKLQDPGKHKYNTLEALGLLDPVTGQWTMLGEPGQTREIGSGEQFRDALEEGGGFIGSMLLSAYLGGAGTEALAGSIGAATGAGATASNIAANALIQGGLGGLAAEMQGGDFEQGFGRGALTGAAGSGINALVSPTINSLAQSASEALSGGTLGSAASGAIRGAGSSVLGSLLRGGNSDEILDALVAGGLSGGLTSGTSSLVGELDLPAPAQRLLTGAITDAALGRDVVPGLLNRGLGELFHYEDPNEAALQAAYGPEGQAERMAEGNFQAQQNAYNAAQSFGDYFGGDPFASIDPGSALMGSIGDNFLTGGNFLTGSTGGVGYGNLEPDFFVTDRGSIIDSAGNQGQFVDGNWVVESTPPGYAPAPAPVPAPAPAPTAAAPTPAPAPTGQRPGAGDTRGLMALAAMLGNQQQQPTAAAPYETANVAPGVQAGLQAIQQMYA